MTDTDADKRFERLLGSFLRDDSSPAAASCPDAGVRAAYYEAKLAEIERRVVEEHVSSCFACQAEAAALVAIEAEAEPAATITEPRKAEAAPPPAAEPPPKKVVKGERWREVFDIPRRSESEHAAEADAPESNAEVPTLPFRPGRHASRWPRFVAPLAVAATAVLAISLTLRYAPMIAEVSRHTEEPRREAAPTMPPAAASPSHDELFTEEPAPAIPRVATPASPAAPAPRSSSEASPFGVEAFGDAKGTRSSGAAAPPAAIAQAPSAHAPSVPEPARPAEPLARREKRAELGTADLAGARLKAESSVLVVARTNVDVAWRLNGGTIARSEDGGKTWRPQMSFASAALVSGSAPSAEVCWIAGKGGTVLRTTDGEHWERLAPPTKDDVVQITAWNAMSATFRTAKGERFSTNDGGQTWAKV